MKKGLSLLFLFLLTMGQAFAEFPEVDIQNFSGQYAEAAGKAQAEKFQVPEVDFGQSNVQFEVYKQASNYVLSANGQEFTLENPPAEIDKLENLSWSDVNVRSQADNFSIEVGSLEGKGDGQALSVKGLSFSCDFQAAINPENDFMNSCLNNEASIKVRSIVQNELKALNSVTGINIRTKKNRFTFALTSGLSIRGNGMIWFEEAENQVKIRIDSAKWKFMNVKSRLFAELKKLESETVSVNNPWIIIKQEN